MNSNQIESGAEKSQHEKIFFQMETRGSDVVLFY